MSEWTTGAPTVSNYERLHGVPERVSEATLWVREGFVSAGWFEKVASSVGKDNARHIGSYAMRGVLMTLSSYKALMDTDANGRATYHLSNNMDIFHKEIERSEQGAITAVRPGKTPEQYVDQGHNMAHHLHNPDLWVVSTESLREALGYGLRNDLALLSRGEAVGRPQLDLFGNDELEVLDWSMSMLATHIRR